MLRDMGQFMLSSGITKKEIDTCNSLAYRTTVNFVNHIKDLLLAFSLPLVLVDVSGGKRQGWGNLEEGN